MLESLHRLEALRGPHSKAREPQFAQELTALKSWQHARLARTYQDLSANPRYAPAADFFLNELYGNKDSAIRDRDLIRMYPTMKRLLPKFGLETAGKALALDVLSEEFDQALTTHLNGAAVTEANYVEAFRAVGRRADRERQVALMNEVGRDLERVVGKPLIYSTLKMLRRPARAAGLGAMQNFLETGFTAFRHMHGAEHFLHTIAQRELTVIQRIMDREPDPFGVTGVVSATER